MKNICLLLAVFLMNSALAQSWKYMTKSDDQGTEYKTAYTNGNGTEYPYHNPVLTIDNKQDAMAFHLTAVGYFQNAENLSITWMFDKNPSEQYNTLDIGLSEDGETVFLNVFENQNSKDIVNTLDFIEKLKNGNRVSIKIEEKLGKNNLSFSLSGSTKAIGFVVSEDFKERMYEHYTTLAENKVEAIRKTEVELVKKEAVKLRIAELLDNYNLNEKQKKIVTAMISYNAALKHFKMIDIDDLSIQAVEGDVHVLLYNKNTELIGTIKKMAKTIPELLEASPAL